VRRRMMPRSIAKVNAKSIDGYFGVATSCFFIRGTILSDTPVDGEYPSLSFMRPGNVVEIAAFDGVWAVVTIRTRPGNRPGDNVSASLYLRDDDLKAHGVDCERIVNLNGLPFAFDVASLAAEGLFDHHDLEPYAPVEHDPDPPSVPAPPLDRHPVEPVWKETPWVEPTHAAATPRPPAPAPTPKPPPQPAPPPAVNARAAREPSANEPLPAFDMASLLELLRSGNSPLGKIGASVAAVAVPVLLYMALAFLKGKPSGDDEL
jgi:hypothetical protein